MRETLVIDVPASIRVSLIGKVFGKLTVVGYGGQKRSGGRLHTMWKCKCDCGKVCSVRGGNLQQKHSTRCKKCSTVGGRNKTHGLSRTQAYYAWRKMSWRVAEWYDIANFLHDLGHAPKGTQMYRPDRYQPYGPGNAFWATKAERRSLRAKYLASLC